MKYAIIYWCNACERYNYEIVVVNMSINKSIYDQIITKASQINRCKNCHNSKNYLKVLAYCDKLSVRQYLEDIEEHKILNREELRGLMMTSKESLTV